MLNNIATGGCMAKTILVLNGSPHKNGNVCNALKTRVEKLSKVQKNEESLVNVIWEDVSSLNFKFCSGCMKCRSLGKCIFPFDDAHKIAEKISSCDAIIVGTPVYWGNMNGKLKALFDRLVYILMGESKQGIPSPLHKGKKAEIVTACTTPFPFNYFCGQSSGAVRAVKEILKSSGFKVVKKTNLAGTKNLDIKTSATSVQARKTCNLGGSNEKCEYGNCSYDYGKNSWAFDEKKSR